MPLLGYVAALVLGPALHQHHHATNGADHEHFATGTVYAATAHTHSAAIAKLGYEFSRRLSLTLFVSAYGSSWRSSGQIPSRAVASGELSHFGAEDPSEGGQTQRLMLNLALRYAAAQNTVDVQLYFVRYKLSIWNNFTLFVRDPLNSDLIEQDDTRSVLGFSAAYHLHRRWRGFSVRMTLGTQVRFDSPTVQLWAASSQNGVDTYERDVDVSPHRAVRVIVVADAVVLHEVVARDRPRAART